MEEYWKKILIAAIVIGLLYLAVFFQLWAAATPSTGDKLKADLDLAPCHAERFEDVKKLFIKYGADQEELVVASFQNVKNLVIKKKGKSDQLIIVGAHYDKTGAGCGAIDNWTGIVILADLYRMIKGTDTEKTYLFVAFGDEEKGLLGSRAMVNDISAENLSQYCAMINLDSFGFSHPQAMTNASDKDLIDLGVAVSNDLEIPFAAADIPGADADSTPFNNRNIPAITFHGMSDNWKDYLHTDQDVSGNINMSSVNLGSRFGLSFLKKVDSSDCGAFR